MPNGIMFALAVITTFMGCLVLFVDVIATKKTDFCQDETPAVYIGDDLGADKEHEKPFRFFVLAFPEFRYEYEGKSYRGRSANVFFHLFLRKGKLAVPFLDGKTYYIYVNPVQPSVFVSAGEQRFAFLHVLGCGIAVLGIILLMKSMGMF